MAAACRGGAPVADGLGEHAREVENDEAKMVGLTATAVVARSYENSEAPRATMAMVGMLDVRSSAQSKEGEGEGE
jgi:hypothetical protein